MKGKSRGLVNRRCVRRFLLEYAERSRSHRFTRVAAELEACYIRQNVEYVKGIYANGAEAYGVVCDFNGIEESCWGFTPHEYADTEGRREIASQIAHKLENAGYIIDGYPVEQSVAVHNYKIRDGLNNQNWTT